MAEINTLFKHSETDDPYAFYSKMVAEHPVYWDSTNKVWSVYSYAACKTILSSKATRIPSPHSEAVLAAMNETTKGLVSNLVRLSNGSQHSLLREAAAQLFHQLCSIDFPALLEPILSAYPETKLDWVQVCKSLTPLSILKGFEFSEQDTMAILPTVPALTMLLSPAISEQQMQELNPTIREVYSIAENHMRARSNAKNVNDPESQHAQIANFIGLLIQSNDAGRGLLTNTLHRCLRQQQFVPKQHDHAANERFVVEVLRHDPPVHNTRRILTETIQLEGQALEAGQTVVIFVAAANRDAAKFNEPDKFDFDRHNSADHLTFGHGAHECIANHFSVRMSASILAFMSGRFPHMKLSDEPISYEPMINVRLPKSLWCSLH